MNPRSFFADISCFIPPDRLPGILEIPGVFYNKNKLTLPFNALDVVEPMLEGLLITRSVWSLTYGPPPFFPLEEANVAQQIADRGVVKPWVWPWLSSYQKEGVCFALPRYGTMLHHATGSGKTVCACVWLSFTQGPAVVVTKASVKRQFAGQITRFLNWEPWIWKPKSQVRKRDKWKSIEEYTEFCKAKGQPPIVVISWEGLSDSVDQLVALKPESVVFDESHKAKSKQRIDSIPVAAEDKKSIADLKARGGWTKRNEDGSITGFLPNDNITRAAELLSKASSRRLAATATPIFKRPQDWWSQLDLLEPWAWGSFSTYAKRYCDAKPGLYTRFDTTGVSNSEELKVRLQTLVHVVSAEVARRNLPPFRRESFYISPEDQCEPSPGFKKEFKDARGSLAELRLFESASRKRKAVISRIVDHVENGEKVVVFTGRHRDCEEMGAAIKTALRSHSCPVLICHGGSGDDVFEQCKETYINSDGPIVLVGTGNKWGTGVDGLQGVCGENGEVLHPGTSAAFFVMLPWEIGMLEQWEGRFIRQGGDTSVIIYYCIAEGTYDEHVASVIINDLCKAQQVSSSGALDGASDALSGLQDRGAINASILALLEGQPPSREDDEDDDD